ncbi:P-loop containing nucleoside triphosphate hydrolase protein [Hygrophoropsis aurantiaca]|uniref:P-loop containing nucleoside triphosphate hydrolase protein n=1 Tax=Hygrophoropsis aurantiaca TaxID=72124 RepID=A0ACB8APC7_9AGAM|nr:P-loop containing nucleoside triphosphate hydrolase protein [Hygrophoropsis aurantiaca]
MSEDLRLNPLALPDTQATPFSASEVVKNAVFRSIPRRIGGKVPGTLVDSVVFGAFNVTWSVRFGVKPQYFILHDGPEQPARDLLLSAGLFQDALHDEVWVFNQGFWNKDHGLWAEIQKASWDDVILKAEFKEALQKDIYGFFKSEPVYKELSIPWKRGLIMYGPPGNGKTISIKTVMKTCAEQGFNPLYVKSFQSFRGEEGAMQDVFAKARQVSPCVIVLEDLDSLINDRNRSFFLNQLDGLEGNDGLLVIGSTNHYDKLDPALSERPSRFDRKYNFDDPDYDGRELYAKYWQGKLKSNKAISFPDSLPGEVAALTAGFSFAYLKEALYVIIVVFLQKHFSSVYFYLS